jgi:hypothetical protein
MYSENVESSSISDHDNENVQQTIISIRDFAESGQEQEDDGDEELIMVPSFLAS